MFWKKSLEHEREDEYWLSKKLEGYEQQIKGSEIYKKEKYFAKIEVIFQGRTENTPGGYIEKIQMASEKTSQVNE